MAGSFKSDIRPMFRDEDIECMSMYGVPLDSYEWMSAGKNADTVYRRLTGEETPRMPDGGPYWDDDMLKKFNDWMTVDPKLQP